MRKGAVKTKRLKNNRIILFLLTFLLLFIIPFTAFAAENGENGHHHVDWEPYFCMQAYDVTMTGVQASELNKKGELENEIVKRSGSVVRVWGSFDVYEGGYEKIDIGRLASLEEPGKYPVVMYLFANDTSSNYIEINVTITEPMPEPGPTPSSTPEPEPEPTPSLIPIPTMEPQEPSEPTQQDEPEAPASQTGKPTPIPQPNPTPGQTEAVVIEAEPGETPAPPAPSASTEPSVYAVKEPEPKETPEPEEEPQADENEVTPLAVGLFGASGIVGILFALSIIKDLGSIRWYNSKRKK